MIYAGIDNGLGGGIVAINKNNNIVFKEVMPIIKVNGKNNYDIQTIIKYLSMLKDKRNIIIGLEQAHVRPVSGKRASFMTGYGYGVIQGILETLKISYELVPPSKWMKELLQGNNKDKSAGIMFCKRMWPNVNWTATERSTKPHTGLIDAVCIAHYLLKRYRK